MQRFTDDALDRLISARAGDANCNGALGNGEYADESYAYDAVSSNLSIKTGMGAYTYGDAAHAHAVTATSAGWAYQYDLNGNLTRRDPPGSDYFDLVYDAENRLASVSGGASAGFAYDGDGRRVKGVVNGTTTIYIGDYFEWTGSSSTVKKYYYADGARIALRAGSALSFLLGDHLGSTAVTADGSGVQTGKLLYKAWGVERFSSGATATSFRYTGQRTAHS